MVCLELLSSLSRNRKYVLNLKTCVLKKSLSLKKMISHLELSARGYSDQTGRSFLGTKSHWTYCLFSLQDKCRRNSDVGGTRGVKEYDSSPFTVQREFWKTSYQKNEGKKSWAHALDMQVPDQEKQNSSRGRALLNSLYEASITQHQNQRWYKEGKPPTRI